MRNFVGILVIAFGVAAALAMLVAGCDPTARRAIGDADPEATAQEARQDATEAPGAPQGGASAAGAGGQGGGQPAPDAGPDVAPANCGPTVPAPCGAGQACAYWCESPFSDNPAVTQGATHHGMCVEAPDDIRTLPCGGCTDGDLCVNGVCRVRCPGGRLGNCSCLQTGCGFGVCG